MGHWLSVNGEAIYSSKPWKHQNDTTTKEVWYVLTQIDINYMIVIIDLVDRYTQKDKTVYSIVLYWPKGNELTLGSLDPSTVGAVELLGEKGELKFTAGSGTSTVITFPHITPDSVAKWAWVLKITTK